MKSYIREDHQKSEFSVHRSVFTSSDILQKERDEIFSKCWIYIGHESELPKNGDFKRKKSRRSKFTIHT